MYYREARKTKSEWPSHALCQPSECRFPSYCKMQQSLLPVLLVDVHFVWIVVLWGRCSVDNRRSRVGLRHVIRLRRIGRLRNIDWLRRINRYRGWGNMRICIRHRLLLIIYCKVIRYLGCCSDYIALDCRTWSHVDRNNRHCIRNRDIRNGNGLYYTGTLNILEFHRLLDLESDIHYTAYQGANKTYRGIHLLK